MVTLEGVGGGEVLQASLFPFDIARATLERREGVKRQELLRSSITARTLGFEPREVGSIPTSSTEV